MPLAAHTHARTPRSTACGRSRGSLSRRPSWTSSRGARPRAFGLRCTNTARCVVRARVRAFGCLAARADWCKRIRGVATASRRSGVLEQAGRGLASKPGTNTAAKRARKRAAPRPRSAHKPMPASWDRGIGSHGAGAACDAAPVSAEFSWRDRHLCCSARSAVGLH